MLYYHTKHVLRKQALKKEKQERKIEDDISDNQDEDSEIEDLNSVDWWNMKYFCTKFG